MWIIPKTYQLYSAFAQGMVESKEDLTLQDLDIESSLMWRSKPTPLKTWQGRWKRVSWMQHLFTRTLKPSHRKSFETKLALLLEDIPANHSQELENVKEKKTQDISGQQYGDTLNQLDLLDACSKMSRDTSRLDLTQSSAIWKKMVTDQRGDYSQRVKSEQDTREKEYSSWPTVTVNGNYNRKGASEHSGDGLATAVNKPDTWPTPRACDSTGGPVLTEYNNGFRSYRHDSGKWFGAKLKDAVMLPTPTCRDYKGGFKEESLIRKDGKSRRFDALPNAAIGGVGTDIVKGSLNPDWVEALMGIPHGWTDLEVHDTDLGWKQKEDWYSDKWEEGIPRVIDGCENRIDRIRLLGNGVVPSTACKAWQVLNERLNNG